MKEGNTELPEFSNPPIVELAIAVQFKAIERLQGPQLGLLWNQYRDRFPIAEQQEPLPNHVESFEPAAQRAKIHFEPKFPVPRFWYLNEEGTRLIQTQQDRFVVNWRKLDTGESYPSYDLMRGEFLQEFRLFQDFIEREGIGVITPDQCALTYVNHIVSGEGWDTYDELDKVTRLWAGTSTDGSLQDLEAVRFRTRSVMSENGEPVGKLYIELDSGSLRSTSQPIFVMRILARGAPEGDGIDGVMRFLDRGHKSIVSVFAATTTSPMHKLWRRTR